MAKAKLIYNIDDQDEALAFYRATRAEDLAMALFEMLYNTKKKFEWELDGKEDTESSHYELLDKVYGRFWEIMEEHDINLDNLIR